MRFRVRGANPVLIVINTIVWVLMLSNALVITVGLERFCDWMEDSLEKEGMELDRSVP